MIYAYTYIILVDHMDQAFYMTLTPRICKILVELGVIYFTIHKSNFREKIIFIVVSLHRKISILLKYVEKKSGTYSHGWVA